MVDHNYIASRIRQLRKSRGMSVDEVGSAIGRSGKTISAWETGRNTPSADMLITICRCFGVNIDYFYPPEVTSTTESVALSPDESELVNLYRALEPEHQGAIMVTVRALARNR